MKRLLLFLLAFGIHFASISQAEVKQQGDTVKIIKRGGGNAYLDVIGILKTPMPPAGSSNDSIVTWDPVSKQFKRISRTSLLTHTHPQFQVLNLNDSLTAIQNRIQSKLSIPDAASTYITISRTLDSLVALRSAIAAKLDIIDTVNMLTGYARKGQHVPYIGAINDLNLGSYDVLASQGAFSISVESNSFVKYGGTSSQFLKADGSVDVNTYLTTTTGDARYLQLTGGTLTGALSGTTYSMSGATNTIGSAVAATNVQLNINGVLSKAARINFQQSGVDKWQIGNGAASEDNNFEIYNSALGLNGLKINAGTNAVSLTGALSGTSATFSGALLLNNNAFTMNDTRPIVTLQQSGVGKLLIGISTGTNDITAGDVAGDPIFRTNGQSFRWTTNAGSTTSMTLNSSGHLLVGTITTDGSSIGQFNGDVTVTGKIEAIGGNGNQLYLDNTGQRYTQMSFFNNNVQKSAIWWDQTAGEFVLFGGFNAVGDLRIASTTGAATFSSSVTANSFIKSGGTSSQYLMADGSVTTGGVSTSGTYTPTLTNIAGFSALTNRQATYVRNGDVVEVSIYIDATASSSGSLSFTATLPIARISGSTSYWSSGVANTNDMAAGAGYVYPNGSATTVTVSVPSLSSGAKLIHIQFTYTIQ